MTRPRIVDDTDDDPDFKPISLEARNKGPTLQVSSATAHAIRLRNRISTAVRSIDDEHRLEAAAALLGVQIQEQEE